MSAHTFSSAVFATLFVVFLFLPVQAQISTIKHNIDTNITSGYWIVTVDFDHDGDPDIVACSLQSGLRWYENDGTGSFSTHTISSSFTDAWSIHANDIDGDGEMDVVSSSADPKNISWFRNNGDGTFSEQAVETNYLHAHGVFAADLDNDEDIDLMAAIWENGSVVWWENNGQENFTRHVLDGNFSSAHAIEAADVDEDGDLDILSGGGSKTAWWENTGNGSFSRHFLGSFGAFGLETSDLDGDGDIDILRNQRTSGDIQWFENSSNSFLQKLVSAEVGEAWSLEAGDLDLDGDKDIVVAEFVPNQITYWLNDGNENFNALILDDTVTRPRCVNLADYDADGDLDIAAILNKNKRVVWYEILGAPDPANTITVTSPNGGEQFEAATPSLISWTSEGEVAAVRLEYSADLGVTWNEIFASVPNSGSQSWQLPNLASDNMLVRVSEVGDPTVSDVSDAPFSLLISSLQLTRPNGGEIWVGNEQQDILWDTVGDVQSVRLEYSVNNGGTWSDIVASTPNTGTFNWPVVDAQTSSALVRVSDASDGSPSDVSDGPFSIDGSTISVTSPNGGEAWFGGTLQPITWTSDGNVDSVRIEYSSDSGVSWNLIIARKVNDGLLHWNVPAILSSNMLVRVSDADDNVPSDQSDNTFSVTPQAITVTAPNGGEDWAPGSQHTITWLSVGDLAAVKIEYSEDAGTTWQVVVLNTPNDGDYLWSIPTTQTQQALVRISDAADGSPSDMSDNFFAIQTPGVTLLSPNGGELWNGGTQHTITWSTVGSIPNVNLEYSLDAGSSWLEIVSNALNTGMYEWDVPNQTNTTTLVRISNYDDAGMFDVSDALFSIVRTALAITHPNGGETLAAGSTQPITWNSNGQIDLVSLFFRANPAADETPIVVNISNTGSYVWTVPNETTDSARVRIEDTTDPAIADDSDGYFTIAMDGLILTSPNGGESWQGGTFHNVTWQTIGNIDSVVVEYSLNRGTNWFVAGKTINTGSYEWQVPNQLTVNALVRISDLNDEMIRDESDDFFTIISSSLTLVSPNGGEEWLTNSTHTVTWQFSGLLQTIRLEYSLDNGRNWRLIANGVPNSGSRAWTLPNTESDSVVVRVSNPESGTPSDVSDQLFTISSIVSSVPTKQSNLISTDFALAPNYPNPFNLGTRIDFSVPQAANVSLRLFDLQGRLVQALQEGQLAAGVYSVTWDGKDRRGKVVPSGIYIYAIRIGRWQAARRLMLVK